MRESCAMRYYRRKTHADPALPRLPGTVARLVCFTVLTRTRSGRVLRGRSEPLVRQETWALLLAHNMIAALAARAAATASLAPGRVSFTAVLSLARAAITADTRCPHCKRRPDDPATRLNAAITALPPGREHRPRTSGRTRTERRKWISEPVTYTYTIVPSNLPVTDITPRS